MLLKKTFRVMAFMVLVHLGFPVIVSALDTASVIAYPVPFNPRSGTTRILTVGDGSLAGYTIEIQVFDINGDLVTRKTGSGGTVSWNGRNDRGDMVKPGLYIIRAILEHGTTGDYGKKLLRILVAY